MARYSQELETSMVCRLLKSSAIFTRPARKLWSNVRFTSDGASRDGLGALVESKEAGLIDRGL